MFHRQIFTSERHRLETIHPLSDYYFLSADPLGPSLSLMIGRSCWLWAGQDFSRSDFRL